MRIATVLGLAVTISVAPTLVRSATEPPSPVPVVSASALPASAAPLAMTTLVPKGTIIVVAIRRSFKSYGLSTGTKVTYDVVQDVIVDGNVIAKAGDVAEGQILNAHEGKSTLFSQEGANLRLSVDKLFTYCGDSIETDFARTEFRNKQGFMGSKKDVESLKRQRRSG